MKTNPLVAALIVSLTLPSLGDTITLKDGKVLEGTVLSEANGVVTVEVLIGKTIKDERRIPKDDIAKIDRVKPDVIAFEALGPLTPTPDLMTESEYAARIKALEKFLVEFPASLKLKDVKEALVILKQESASVAAGGVKISGKMVPPEEYKPNAYELDARVQEMKIRDLLNKHQVLSALREFSSFKQDYSKTVAFNALLPLMKTTIQRYAGEASQLLLSLDARTKARLASVAQMSPTSRSATENAIREESEAIDARYKAEKQARIDWPTTSPYHKQSLEDTVRFAQTELTRLDALKVDLEVDGGKAFRELYNLVQNDGSASAVSTAASAAKSAGVPARYIDPLVAAAKGRK